MAQHFVSLDKVAKLDRTFIFFQYSCQVSFCYTDSKIASVGLGEGRYVSVLVLIK